MALSLHLRQRRLVKNNIQTNHYLGINNILNKPQILIFGGQFSSVIFFGLVNI